jgi:hypothetical protein
MEIPDDEIETHQVEKKLNIRLDEEEEEEEDEELDMDVSTGVKGMYVRMYRLFVYCFLRFYFKMCIQNIRNVVNLLLF